MDWADESIELIISDCVEDRARIILVALLEFIGAEVVDLRRVYPLPIQVMRHTII
jgi:hypothetical protein